MKKFFKKIWDTIGFWVLISPFIIVPLALIVFSVVGTISEFSEPKTSKVVTKYDEGYGDGFSEGMNYAQKELASQIEDLYYEIYGFSDNYPVSMEDAEATLFCYADCDEEFTEEEIKEAILIALEYKDNVNDLIYDIDEMEIY